MVQLRNISRLCPNIELITRLFFCLFFVFLLGPKGAASLFNSWTEEVGGGYCKRLHKIPTKHSLGNERLMTFFFYSLQYTSKLGVFGLWMQRLPYDTGLYLYPWNSWNVLKKCGYTFQKKSCVTRSTKPDVRKIKSFANTAAPNKIASFIQE